MRMLDSAVWGETPRATMITSLLLTAATLAPASALAADKVGTPLPPVQIEGLTQSPTSSFDEFTGRLLLIEFFAYW